MSKAIIVRFGTLSYLSPPQNLCSLTWNGPRCLRKTRSKIVFASTPVMLYTTFLTNTAIDSTVWCVVNGLPLPKS